MYTQKGNVMTAAMKIRKIMEQAKKTADAERKAAAKDRMKAAQRMMLKTNN